MQNRMSFQGEWFAERYGKPAAGARAAASGACSRWASRSAPARTARASRATTRGPRSTGSSRAGRSGGTALRPEGERLSREEALRLWTRGSAWFSAEEDEKGAIAPGFLADVAVLSKDYFAVPEDEIKTIESVLTVVGGKVVHAADSFAAARTAASAREPRLVARRALRRRRARGARDRPLPYRDTRGRRVRARLRGHGAGRRLPVRRRLMDGGTRA